MNIDDFLINENFIFKKKEIVGKTNGILSGTNMDSHNHKMTVEALKSMKEFLEVRPWIILEHDPSKCPIGIISFLEIQAKEDGEFYLYAETDVIDQNAMDMIISGKLKGFSPEFTIKNE